MDQNADLVASWLRLVRRRWRTGALIFLGVAAVGAASILLARPVYRAEAALRLGEPPPPGGVSPSGGLLSLFQMGGDAFANDLELLASRTLAEAVAEAHALHVTLAAPPGWHRDSLVASLEADRSTVEAVYTVRWEDDGRIHVRQVSPEASPVGDAPPHTALRFGGVSATFLPWREGMPREIQLATEPFAQAVRELRGSIEVERPRREANVLSVAWNHTDPGLAEGVVATVIDAFTSLRTAVQHRESVETADSLRGVSRRTAEELRLAEEALETLQREGGIVAPDAQGEAVVERHSELLGRLQRARAEVAAVDETLRRLDAADDPGRSWTALLSYPAFLQNETLGNLLSDLVEVHGEREALASRRSPQNRELRVLDERIRYLDGSLRQLAREYRAGLVEQIASLEPEAARLDAYMRTLPAQAVELGRRHRDVRILTEVLVLTEQRLRQEELREALTYANVQVIDPSALRDRPVWPRKKLGLAVVLLLAGGSGLLGMVVRERSDPRLRSVDDVERVLGAPVLAVVDGSGDEALRFSEAEAAAHYDQTILMAMAEVETSLSTYQKMQDRIFHLEEAAAASERAAALARLRFEEGATSFLEVLDAERTQLLAQDQLAVG
ncbi:MAG: TolC family protein, partial [Gemmatimonadetes bacterium]|nr:TolC family protein [Gemmatimonadota bacterium]